MSALHSAACSRPFGQYSSFFNLKRARGARARKVYSEVQAIWTEMAQVQTELAMAVAGLRQEVDRRMSQQLRLF